MISPKCDEIKKRRENLGVSAKKLGLMAGLSGNSIYRIEQGQSKTTHPIRARAIAAALGCELEDVFICK